MAGPDVLEAEGWRLTLSAPRKHSLRDFKIAIMYDDPNSEVDRDVQDRLAALAKFLSQRGATVSDKARPDIDLDTAHDVYIRSLRAATSRALNPETFQRQLEEARGLDPADRRYYARMLRGNTILHRDWLDLDEARHRLRYKWAEFFRDYDLLLCPPAASTARPHDHDGERHERKITVNDRAVPTTDQMFWAGISTLADLPATVAPIGLSPEGLPVGVQIVGPGYGDQTCLAFAGLLERDYCAFVPPPAFGEPADACWRPWTKATT
jgi:amidase